MGANSTLFALRPAKRAQIYLKIYTLICQNRQFHTLPHLKALPFRHTNSTIQQLSAENVVFNRFQHIPFFFCHLSQHGPAEEANEAPRIFSKSDRLSQSPLDPRIARPRHGNKRNSRNRSPKDQHWTSHSSENHQSEEGFKQEVSNNGRGKA